MVLKEENGSDSIAVPLVDEKHWDELVILIAVVFYIYSLSDNCFWVYIIYLLLQYICVTSGELTAERN